MRTVQHEIARLRGEFMEMPGLRLTIPQAQRLCGLEGTLCKLVLDSLVDAKFLNRDSSGAYARMTDEAMRHTAAKPRRSA
jgi:hypothetical protein